MNKYGVPVQVYIRENISPYLHFSTVQDSIARIYNYELFKGAKNSAIAVVFRNENGKTVSRNFIRTDKTDFPKISFNILPGNYGHLVINNFANAEMARLFDSLFDKISTTRGLIIDVRTNGGGSSNVGYEILSYFAAKPFYTSLNIMREIQRNQSRLGKWRYKIANSKK